MVGAAMEALRSINLGDRVSAGRAETVVTAELVVARLAVVFAIWV